MKYINILEGFEREIARIDDAIEKPSTDDSLFWLNQAVGKFTKERFNGDFVHRTSYEQNEKRSIIYWQNYCLPLLWNSKNAYHFPESCL